MTHINNGESYAAIVIEANSFVNMCVANMIAEYVANPPQEN